MENKELDRLIRELDQENFDNVANELGGVNNDEELRESFDALSDEDKFLLMETILQKTSPIQPTEKIRQYRSNQGRSPERMEVSYKVFVWTVSMVIILIIILVITATL
jgi:hypothetical protein